MTVELKGRGQVPFLSAVNGQIILLSAPNSAQYAGNFTGIIAYRRSVDYTGSVISDDDGVQFEFKIEIIGTKLYAPYYCGYEPELSDGIAIASTTWNRIKERVMQGTYPTSALDECDWHLFDKLKAAQESLEEIVLSDETSIANTKWKYLKETAMLSNYKQQDWYGSLEEKNIPMLEALRESQENQNNMEEL